MAKHLSIRLPWHDRGWDGHVCDNPTANVYCAGEYGLKAHGIRDGKDAVAEEKTKSMPLHMLPQGGYRPPCIRTIQAFGGQKFLPFLQEPKSFLHTRSVQIAPIAEEIAPCTAGTWPYDQVFRRAEDAPDGTPEKFAERFSPNEARNNIREFFDGFDKGRGLAFFYLNYDNPLNAERHRYVLVGAAEIDAITEQQHWATIDPEKEAIYGDLVWNRFISHGYDDGRGARIPYERYLRKGLDPTDVVVEIPSEMSRFFKYVCRPFTDDEAAMLLRELLAALERGKGSGAVEWQWDGQIEWINRALDKVLKDRGTYPGLGPVLQALGFKNAIIYADRFLSGAGIPDARAHVLERLSNASLAETPEARSGFTAAAQTLRVLPESVTKLLLDRLSLFELTTEQVRLIAGGGLVNQADRTKTGLQSDASEIHENPYLVVEEFDPLDHEERIPFHRIDQGIYLARAAGAAVPGLETFGGEDRRRLRAAAISRLRIAEEDGHSFLTQDELLSALGKMRLTGMPALLGPVALARDIEFHEQRLSVLKGSDFVGWMLKVTGDDESLIRTRVEKLVQRKAIVLPAIEWQECLPQIGMLPPNIAKVALESQREVLAKLASQPLSLLTGGAGTGKTTVIATLIKGLTQANVPEKFVLLAPTGKAAVRLRRKIFTEAGIDLQPLTIHSYLLQGKWLDSDTFRPVREGSSIVDGATTVIVDECSMLDTALLSTLFRAIDWSKVRRIILSGDPQQLPPIGVGAPFKNLVDQFSVSSAHKILCELTVNCRQHAEGSTALKLADQFSKRGNRVIADELLEAAARGGRIGADLEVRYFLDERDFSKVLTGILGDAVTELLTLEKLQGAWNPDQPWKAFDTLHRFDSPNIVNMKLDAIEVLSPYRAGFMGSDAANQQIQSILRGKLMRGGNLLGKASGRQYLALDKVLQVRNKRLAAWHKLTWKEPPGENVDLFVANGELGRVMKVGKHGDERIGWIRFETDPLIAVSANDKWAEQSLDLGYAMTVHKAQGSDFGGVIVILPNKPRQRMMSRELLYTAMTRFTKRLYLLVQGNQGDVAPLIKAIWPGASEYLRRNTSLYTPRPAIKDLEDFQPGKRIIRTVRDELVASKSEALIANMLHGSHIPYEYEKLLLGKDGSPRRPDFTIPVETPDGPDVIYWEHWGMMGDPVYDASVKRRRDWYEKNGFAKQLVETDEIGGFDSREIEQVIQRRIMA